MRQETKHTCGVLQTRTHTNAYSSGVGCRAARRCSLLLGAGRGLSRCHRQSFQRTVWQYYAHTSIAYTNKIGEEGGYVSSKSENEDGDPKAAAAGDDRLPGTEVGRWKPVLAAALAGRLGGGRRREEEKWARIRGGRRRAGARGENLGAPVARDSGETAEEVQPETLASLLPRARSQSPSLRQEVGGRIFCKKALRDGYRGNCKDGLYRPLGVSCVLKTV
jgi:hypothetical protein